ncbi:MAG TPA: hypothetical protein VFL42_13750, partial [Terriglobales bacterium]|nr:hypothetical protein [Terriglobales bacterium]
MLANRTASLCSLVLAMALGAIAQDNGSPNGQDNPTLKTRPDVAQPQTAPSSAVYGAPANAIPEGKRFIIKLKDTLDTHKLNEGKRFKAELREDLVAPDGEVIARGRTIRAHVARYEHGFTGARLMLAMDEIETRHGWAPL